MKILFIVCCLYFRKENSSINICLCINFLRFKYFGLSYDAITLTRLYTHFTIAGNKSANNNFVTIDILFTFVNLMGLDFCPSLTCKDRDIANFTASKVCPKAKGIN